MAKSTGQTLLHKLDERASKLGDGKTALKYPRDGKWFEVSWAGYRKAAEHTAAGLVELGLKPGDKLSLLSGNCVEWFYTDLGAMALGAATVAIYPNYTEDQIQYIIEHSESKILAVRNAADLEKSLPLLDKVDVLEYIVVFENEGVEASEKVILFSDLVKTGEKKVGGKSDFWSGLLDALDYDSLATIQYTSGTTGPPKGAMLSHRNIASMARILLEKMTLEQEETISFLPISHIAERLQGIYAGVAAGNTVTFARSLDTLRDDLVQVRPTILMCVPRLYEKFYAAITEGVSAAGGLKEKLFTWTLNVGDQVRVLRNDNGKSPSPILALKWAVAQKLVADKLKAKLGMDECTVFVSGAAPLSAEVARFFGSLGMDILEVYGQTECVGVCTSNPIYGVRPGTVGTRLPGIDVKIAEDGEILVKGDTVFMGYYKQPDATAETLVDGWLYTGDVGVIDGDGYLKITDRKKDIIVTAGGKNVAPQNIENQLKPFPGISQVVILGDKRKFLTALVTLDPEALPGFMAELGLDKSEAGKAHENEKVIARIQEYFDKINDKLARFERIKYFKILPEDFTVESGEMTPSLKVKRRVVQENYKSILDKFYGE